MLPMAERTRRENEEEERRPGARPLAGRGERPKLLRFAQGERLREENFQRIMQRGRSMPAFMPRPFIQVHHAYTPLHMPCYPIARYGQFGYVDPNALSPPKSEQPQTPSPMPPVLCFTPSPSPRSRGKYWKFL